MTLSEALLPEFDQEMAKTRTTLERVPEDKLSWKPHPKSPTMAWLATHLAMIPSWTPVTLMQDSFDVNPAGQKYTPPPPASSCAELLATFDKNVTSAREMIAGTEDARWMQTWSLLSNGQPISTMPRIAVVRGFIMNHSIHHRAQLGVYLRLNDVPVPALYGPSADEAGM